MEKREEGRKRTKSLAKMQLVSKSQLLQPFSNRQPLYLP